MGQEFLEDKPWSDNPDEDLNIFFDGLSAQDNSMRNHLRFTRVIGRLEAKSAWLERRRRECLFTPQH
jgi:1,4-alpha-glucan branching enzyme